MMHTKITSENWTGILFSAPGMTMSCDRCHEPITSRYGWNRNSMVCESCLVGTDTISHKPLTDGQAPEFQTVNEMGRK